MAATKGHHYYTERFRKRIKTSLLRKRLQDHVADPEKYPLLATQIRAAEILLKKAVPDLTSTELSGEVSTRTAKEVSDDALANIATGSGAGTVGETSGEKDPSAVH